MGLLQISLRTHVRANNTRLTLLLLTMLIIASASFARWGASKNSATYDEPLHLAASYVTRYAFDLRVNPEHPPLWKLLVGLTMSPGDVPAERGSGVFAKLADVPKAEWQWATTVLYRSGRVVDVDGLLASGRDVTLFWGAGLLVMVAITGCWLGGVRGVSVAVLSVALLGFDPTFLGHTAMVTNDVPFALAVLLFGWALARWMRQATWGGVVMLGLAGAMAVLTKFAAVALIPMSVAGLVYRSYHREEWISLLGIARTKLTRLGTGVATLCISVLIAYLGVWAGYGFTYAPGGQLQMEPELSEITKGHTSPTPISVKIILFSEEHHLLPQPLCRGLLTQYRIAQTSRAYVLGENREPAPLYALPLAFLLKTPVGLLAAILLAVMISSTQKRSLSTGYLRPAILICGCVFLAVAIASGRGRGVRYLLPMLPLGYVWVASVLGRTKWLTMAGMAFVGLSVLEITLVGGGRFVSFFNLPSKVIGPSHLMLGDSNLDWGQGLKELAGWQRSNSDQTLYLAYFGMADPRSYGLIYKDAAPAYLLDSATKATSPTPGSLLAISTTILQGTYLPTEMKQLYVPYVHKAPYAVLAGGSILIFRVD